jgi:hypothetical protein
VQQLFVILLTAALRVCPTWFCHHGSQEACLVLKQCLFVGAAAVQSWSDLAADLARKVPSKIDIGPVYTHDPRQRAKYAKGEQAVAGGAQGHPLQYSVHQQLRCLHAAVKIESNTPYQCIVQQHAIPRCSPPAHPAPLQMCSFCLWLCP